MNPTTVQLAAAIILGVALLHTFSTDWFEHLAHTRPKYAALWRLLGEVELVFGLWAIVLLVFMSAVEGGAATSAYVNSRRFTEPAFVFAILVVAGSRPIIEIAGWLARILSHVVAAALRLDANSAFYFIVLSLVPLLGSFITEPGAMTLGAMLLRDRAFRTDAPKRIKYLTLGVLFVNVSIGGTLTPFAAPPVLMVAHAWEWDLAFMLATFGWRAALAVGVNAAAATLIARRALAASVAPADGLRPRIPMLFIVVNLALLAGIAKAAHDPATFIGLLCMFVALAKVYERYHDPLLLREGVLVAFFLAGLVVLGGQQEWWLQPLISSAGDNTLYFGATALTAVTDNAALTYLGSLVQGLSDSAKYALVAGAVTGGGLTVIANAPNPAGFSLLKDRFDEGAIHPGGLFLAALGPTMVAIVAFWVL